MPLPAVSGDGPGTPNTQLSRWNGRFSITVTLVTAIGLLTLISVGVVLGVGVWLAQKNTFALLSDNAHQSVSAAVSRIEQHLRPAEHQAKFLSKRIAAGEIDPTDHKQLGILLTGALAAAPQIETVMFIDNRLQSFYANANPLSGDVTVGVFDYSKDPIVKENIARATLSGDLGTAIWGAAIWRETPKKTYLNVAYPTVVNGKFMGVVVAVVSVEHLSDFLSTANTRASGQRFILSGRERVLAHPLMADGYPGRTDKAPLPLLKEFKDRILASIWQQQGRHELALELPAGTEGHVLEREDEDYIFVYQSTFDFGPEPLITGIYFPRSEIGEEVRRMIISLAAGIVALFLSVGAAIYIGRKIAQPIVGFSNAAGRIRDLDISQVENLPGSVFRELNDQSASFNAMLRALRWFELYVPKKLVARLVKSGDVHTMTSDDRNITVMFTDIVKFSTISQGMSAREVAALVNHHFALIGECIDAEEGTIDKFIGDSVMAIWGAPEKQKNRAERACRAALAIASAIRKDNKERVAEGKPAISMRIGIHTGNATVGNIGAPGHINYTIIGDAVNIGQRLEQLCKEVYPQGTEVSILISGDTARDLGDTFQPIPAGRFELKGRAGDVEVFKLQ